MATSPNATQITPPRVPIIDERTGAVSREWYRWFYSLYNIVGGGLGIIPVSSGGTGLSTIPTNGQLLIGNGTGYTLNTLAVGSGISVVNGLGTITLANTGVLSNLAGTGISVSSATGNVTIANTGVLSFSGGTTGLTPAAVTTGAITLAGTLAIANGGTNGSATPTTYGVAYGTGTAYAFTAAGTAKQVLIANTSSAPTWATLTSGTSILYGDGSGGFSNVTIGSGVSFVAGTLSATGLGGTVTSVTGTSPVNVATGTTTPVISLASGYGDTQNPYASKTANYVLAAPNGSAGVPTFRALVAADVPGSALTKTDDTNVTLTLGGSPTTALLNAASLTLGWSGQLAVGRGGTGLSAGTSGGIPYFSSTSAMTSSALLTQYGVIYGGGAGASPVATAAGTTGQILTATTGGAPTWSSTYAGTVTSVSFTGGIITVATATTTPALTVAGTSGGVPYFSSASTWATSAALAANAIVLGGGAGAAPATTTTGTGVVTALGVNTGTAGAFVVNGGALGTPSSGTVTNLTGTASININGTVGATTPAAGTFTSLSDSGNLTFTGTGNRITGDFSTGTITNRAIFQTSTVNSVTDLSVIPNGTSAQARINLIGDSAATNAATLNMGLFSSGTIASIRSDIIGTGTYIPLTFNIGGSERARIDTAGNFGIGTSSPNASAILDAQSTTKGVRFPNMTTTQKNAISSPAAGLVVFDTTLAKLCVYSGAAWQTITSI